MSTQPAPMRIVNFEITTAQDSLPVLSYTSDTVFVPNSMQVDKSGVMRFLGSVRGVDGNYSPMTYEIESPEEGWSSLEGPMGFALVRFDAFGGMHEPVKFTLERSEPGERSSAPTAH